MLVERADSRLSNASRILPVLEKRKVLPRADSSKDAEAPLYTPNARHTAQASHKAFQLYTQHALNAMCPPAPCYGRHA